MVVKHARKSPLDSAKAYYGLRRSDKTLLYMGSYDVRSTFATYTRNNAQVAFVTSLQTSCNKSVHKLSTSCFRTACS